jgi:hypothetical protein
MRNSHVPCRPPVSRGRLDFALSCFRCPWLLPRIVRDETVRKTPDTVRTQNYFI